MGHVYRNETVSGLITILRQDREGRNRESCSIAHNKYYVNKTVRVLPYSIIGLLGFFHT